MQYKYGLNQNYEDFASGRVLYNAAGIPNFPVRLINEIYGRCLVYSDKKENICLYDCCCGGGYSLTVLGLLNQRTISEIIGTDIDLEMVKVANSNLALLTKEGLDKRKEEIHTLYENYYKAQHKEAEQSAERLMKLLVNPLYAKVTQADALHLMPFVETPDIIITDVPYGGLVKWQGNNNCIDELVASLEKVSSRKTIIAISMDKNQKITCSGAMRLERQIIGKRKFEIFKYL